MIPIIRKIGLAIAFSPRIEALLAEAARLKKMWDAELLLIHVGNRGKELEERLQQLLESAGLSGENSVKIFWETGKPSERILSTCRKERIDLLIA